MHAATALQDLAIMFIDEEVREDQLQLYEDDTAPYYGQPDIPRLLDSIAASCPVRRAHSKHCLQTWQSAALPCLCRTSSELQPARRIDVALPSETEVFPAAAHKCRAC